MPDRNGTPDTHQETLQLITSLGLIYRALGGTFRTANYHEGDLKRFLSDERRSSCEAEGLENVNADLLVGADGSRSLVHQQ
jgi:2-polyprenyl-6-methoxyphenol hydroxylase-like FAD-dependent oxidoreductase